MYPPPRWRAGVQRPSYKVYLAFRQDKQDVYWRCQNCKKWLSVRTEGTKTSEFPLFDQLRHFSIPVKTFDHRCTYYPGGCVSCLIFHLNAFPKKKQVKNETDFRKIKRVLPGFHGFHGIACRSTWDMMSTSFRPPQAPYCPTVPMWLL